MPRQTAYVPQLLTQLTITEDGMYLISRASAAKVLQADVERHFGNGLSFDETLDLVLAECNYDPKEPRFSLPDEAGNRHIPLDVAVVSWVRWATGGSEQARLLLSNLAVAGII
jgi:hypothetical protein